MVSNTLEKLGSQYMQVWSSGNEHLLDHVASEDLQVDYTHFEKPYQGANEYKEMLRMTYNYFPDLEIIIKDLMPNTEKNNVTIFWEYHGTHKNGKLFGVESTGKKVAVKGITVLEIEKELIKKESGIVDNMSLIMQLGVL